MKHSRSTALAIILFAATTSIAADPPAATLPSVTADHLQILLAALGNDNYQSRTAAQKEISALGEDMLPALHAAYAQIKDPDVQSLFDTAIQSVEIRAATTPTFISVDLKDRPLHELLNAISPNNGYLNLDNGAAEKQVSFRANHMPMLEAIATAGEKFSFGLMEQRNGKFSYVLSHKGLFARSTDNMAMIYNGKIDCHRWVDLATNNRPEAREDWVLAFDYAFDPRIQLFMTFPRVTLEKAEDDHGKTFTAPHDSTGGSDAGPGGSVSASLGIEPPPEPGRHIAILKGYASFFVVVHRVALDAPLNKEVAVNSRSGKITVRWEEKDGSTIAHIIGGHPKGLTVEALSHCPPTEISAIDAQGNELGKCRATRSTTYNNDWWDYSYPLENPAKTAGVRVSVVDQVQEIQVPFEFKNLPMP